MRTLYRKKACKQCKGERTISYSQNIFHEDGSGFYWENIKENCPDCDGHGYLLIKIKG